VPTSLRSQTLLPPQPLNCSGLLNTCHSKTASKQAHHLQAKECHQLCVGKLQCTWQGR
jgi:hypothetical protein